MERRVRLFVIVSLLIILVLTLFPFNFSLAEGFSIQEIARGFHHVSNPQDLLANILLFFPFGFSCAWLMNSKGFRGIKVILTVLAISLSLSTIVEVLQLFLPDRFSTKSDIFTNILGGLFGYLSFLLLCFFYSPISLKRLRKVFNSRRLLLYIISYFIIIIWITIPFLNATSLNNWNTDFPLILGNEATGNRPWQGYITQMSIFDRAFSIEEIQKFLTERDFVFEDHNSLLVSYNFSGKEHYDDRSSQIPVLAWQGQASSVQAENLGKRGVYLNQDHWLATPIAPTLMTERIRHTSQFTLYTNIATANLKQTGPARIISLSRDPHNRNFTIGQQDKDLVFRLRTPLMGENGSNFELSIPDVFTDTNHHRLLISYYDSVVKIYIDEINNFYLWKLMPEAAVFEPFLFDYFENCSMLTYKVLYYILIFVPLGFWFALFSIKLRKRLIFNSLLIGGGIVFSAALVQSLLANASDNIDLTSFLLSIAIATITFFLVRVAIFLRVSSTTFT